MLSLGLVLLFVGIIIGTLGRILHINIIEKFGNTVGGIGVFLGVVGLLFG